MPRIGDITPDFEADTTQGEIKFHEWLGGSWGVLLSHPTDFVPICTTGLGQLAMLNPEFAKRNVKVIAISLDSIPEHHKWIKNKDSVYKTTDTFPIISDHDRKVSVLYELLDQTHIDDQTGLPLTVRGVFIIDPSKKVRLIITNPASTGRSFDEIIRAIDSLQLSS